MSFQRRHPIHTFSWHFESQPSKVANCLNTKWTQTYQIDPDLQVRLSRVSCDTCSEQLTPFSDVVGIPPEGLSNDTVRGSLD